MINLPENKNDRNKMIAAICIGTVVIFYVVFTFVLQPYLASVLVRKARVAELEDFIWRAQKELTTVNQNLEKNTELVRAILKDSEINRHILRPSLGNYLLVASDILTTAAAGLKMTIGNISEIPLPAPPKPAIGDKKVANPANALRFAPYTVNVSISAGAHALTLFLRKIENANPYLTVTRMTVMGQAEEDPEVHFISLHIQWPIWVNNEYPHQLAAEQIADEEQQ